MTYKNRWPGSEPADKKPSTLHVAPHVTLHVALHKFGVKFGKNFRDEEIVVSLIRERRSRHINSIYSRIREAVTPEFPYFPDNLRGIHRRHTDLPAPDRSSVRVAEYLTELPSREQHDGKKHAAIRRTKEQLERRGDGEAGGKKKEELGYGE